MGADRLCEKGVKLSGAYNSLLFVEGLSLVVTC